MKEGTRQTVLALAIMALLSASSFALAVIGGGPGIHVIKGNFARTKEAIEINDVTSQSAYTGLTYLIAVIENTKLSAEEKKELIRLILKRGANIDDLDKVGDSALVHAIRLDDAALVLFLINNGASVDSINIRGETPVSIAILNRQGEIEKILRAHGADTDTRNASGWRPIEELALRGDLEAVKIQIKKEPEAIKEIPGVLVAAGGSGNTALLRYLVEVEHMDVNGADEQGITAMHTSAGNNHVEAIKYLRGKGAAVNTSGVTPLMIASSMGHDDAVVYLVEHGADVNAVANKENSAVYQSVAARHFGTATYLIQKGASFPKLATNERPLVTGMLHYLYGVNSADIGNLSNGAKHMRRAKNYLMTAKKEAESVIEASRKKRRNEALKQAFLAGLGAVSGQMQANMNARQSRQIAAMGRASNMGAGPAGYFREYGALSQNINPGSTSVQIQGAQNAGSTKGLKSSEIDAIRVNEISKEYLNWTSILGNCYQKGGNKTALVSCIEEGRKKLVSKLNNRN